MRETRIFANEIIADLGDRIKVLQDSTSSLDRKNWKTGEGVGSGEQFYLHSTEPLGHCERRDEWEVGHPGAKKKSPDGWAGHVAERTGPDALWYELSEKDKKISDIEERLRAVEAVQISRTCSDIGSPEIVEMCHRMKELEDSVAWEVWPYEEKSPKKKASEHKMAQGGKRSWQ